MSGGGWHGRSLLVMTVFVLTAALLAARALDLQVIRRHFLASQGAIRHLRVIKMPAYRGVIEDRRGQPLAISTPVDSIWVDPKVIRASQVSLSPLAHALGLSLHRVDQIVAANRNREFAYVQHGLPPSKAKQVLRLGLPGVHAQPQFRRYYPAGPVAGQVIGFTNYQDQGQYGLELEYNKWLKGVPGAMRVVSSGLGQAVADDQIIKRPQPGRTLMTSLDMRIQYLAYRALTEAVDKHDATTGSAIVVDVRTGGVLADVNDPSFNPNVRSDLKASLYRNRAVSDVFEPGSTFKPFIISAALSTGKWFPDSLVKTGNGTLRIGGYTIHDDEALGTITLTTLLEKSSNVGAAKVALSLNPSYLWHFLADLGIGQSSSLGFPGAASGSLPFYPNWHPVEQAAISRGYGVSVTALKLAQAYLAIADGGVARPVSFLKQKHPPSGHRVMSSKIAAEVRNMMTTVVSDKGTGELAKIPNYRVAGKTGTARLYKDGEYLYGLYNSVFVGMAPAAHPRLITVVVIRGASHGGYFGGLVAAPVFQKIMGGALRLMNVSPDDLSHLANVKLVSRGGTT